MSDGFIQAEYLEIFKTITKFDEYSLLIKGWSITFGMATLLLAFDKGRRAIFIVAIAASTSFWILDANYKYYQNNYYPRMRQIELKLNDRGGPQIDHSWRKASEILPYWLASDSSDTTDANNQDYDAKWLLGAYMAPFIYPNVFLPHIVVIFLGLIGIRGIRCKTNQHNPV